MRRLAIVLSIVLICLGTWRVAAQEGTPAGAVQPPPGLGVEALAFAPVEALPSTPAFALMDRLTLDPGSSIPGEAGDPSNPQFTLLYVESGELTLVGDVPFSIMRGSALDAMVATPGAGPELEQVEPQTTVTLTAGDSVSLPAEGEGDIRNDGEQPVVMLLVAISPAG